MTPSPTASTSDAHLDPDEYPNYTQGGIYSYWTDGKSPWISWTTSEIVMNSVGVHLEAGWFDCDHWAVDDWHDENYMSPTGWQHLYTLEHRAGQFLSGYKMSGCADIWDPEPTDHHITYQLDGVKFYNEEKRDVSYEDIQAVILFDCSQGASITYENVFTTIHFDQATISAGASSWAEGVWTYCVEYFRKRTSIVYKGERPTFYPIAFD